MIRNETFEGGVCIRAEVIDLDAGTVTIEEHGKPISTRPITTDERTQWTPVTPVATPDEKLAAARRALAQLADIDGPILAPDIADALADVAAALEDR